jgi:hypothetical protein
MVAKWGDTGHRPVPPSQKQHQQRFAVACKAAAAHLLSAPGTAVCHCTPNGCGPPPTTIHAHRHESICTYVKCPNTDQCCTAHMCASCAQAPAAQTPATVHIISSVRYTAATRVQARQGLAPTACKQIRHASSVLFMKTNLSTVAAHCHCFPCPGQRTQTQLAGASIAVSGTIMNHPTQPPTTYKAQACTDCFTVAHLGTSH